LDRQFQVIVCGMISEHAAPVGTPGVWTESWTRLPDGGLAHQFEYVVSARVWLGREDRVGDDGVAVPGPMRIYIDGENGEAAARALNIATVLGL
jgi:hypothetical protein